MRPFSRFKNRGFTLVELMIVVAIIGVLAALAIYGVRRYLASAKTSEAKNTLGSIARGAQGAFEREQAASELLAPGATGAQLSHNLCGTSNEVPLGIVPAGNKIQPSPTEFEDTAGGNSANVGWQCLKFSVSTPVYYQYGYNAVRLAPAGFPGTEAPGSSTIPASIAASGLPTDPAYFIAHATGDLDGDSTVSEFGIRGAVDTASRTVRVATQVQIINEYE